MVKDEYMPTIFILHGPNLNLLGEREPEIYGSKSLEEINLEIIKVARSLGLEVEISQSNSEGELITFIQEARKWAQGIVFNPGGYTHTSVAIRDAISAIGLPVIEVHLSNIFSREGFRKDSVISPVCVGTISGFGWYSYVLGIHALKNILLP